MMPTSPAMVRIVAKRSLRPTTPGPISRKRAAYRKLQAKLTTTVHGFLRKQAEKVIGQVIVLRAPFIKADLSQDEIDQLNAVVNGIDFAGWAVLAGEVEPILEAIGKDSSYAALLQTHIDVEARPKIANIVKKMHSPTHAIDLPR